MDLSGWIRKLRSNQGHEPLASELVHAAARGESLDHLLDLAVRTLLEAAAGDRAGLWLAGNRLGESGWGRVVESTRGPVPEQWKHLDISTPLLRDAMESREPLFVELGSKGDTPSLGPLAGMQRVVWVPLRFGNSTFGLAMVAYERPSAKPDLDAIRERGNEIALVIKNHHDARRSELRAEELHAQLRISRATLCGVSVESILSQIARAARQYLQAAFIAVGGVGKQPSSAEGWDGTEVWRAWVQQDPLLQLWRMALEQGRDFDITGEVIPAPIRTNSESSGLALERLVAIPIEVRNRTAGVLMAGLMPPENGDEDLTRLESYVQLAASALDQEFSRQEREAGKNSLRQIIGDSDECLVVIDENGIVREASNAASAFLTLSRRRNEGILLEDFFSAAVREEVVQWRHRWILSGSNALHNERPPFHLEAPLEHGPIARLHLRSKMDGLGNGTPLWLIHIEKPTDPQTMLAREGRLAAEMDGLLDSIDSGILLLDPDGKIRTVSDRLGAILGIESRPLFELGTVESLMDALAPQLRHPVETVARWRKYLDRGNEANWDEFELVRPKHRIVERFGRPLFDADGSRLGWLEVYRDITSQRLIQSKLLQTEKMAALGQLVSGIAHELNNPLTSIQGYAQLLLTRRSELDRTKDASRIAQEAERAGHIVKNLLLFSRETKPERRAVSLNEVIGRTLALRSYELKLENIDVELMLDPGLPHTLADAAQLQQVILNLIVNAEQAIEQGRAEKERGGRIQIRTRRLKGDRIRMEVSDDGPGISTEIVSRIFDPFFTTKPVGVGTGLELSIVYGIAQEHGGEVSVESQLGHGATLTVELPAVSLAALDFIGVPLGPAAAATPSSSAPATIGSQRILVVEDEPTVAQLIADVLTEEGHRVDMLLDSREALGRLEKRRYGLVVCDLKMPHLDGRGLYHALVGRGNPLQQKILFVTGDTMSPRTLEFLKSSGLPYLAKPFLVEELKDSVRQAFGAIPGSEETAVQERLRAVAREK